MKFEFWWQKLEQFYIFSLELVLWGMISDWSWTNGEMTERQGVEGACRISGSFSRGWLSTSCVSCTAQKNERSHRSWWDRGFTENKQNSRRGQVKHTKNGRFDQCAIYWFCEILLGWPRSSFGFFLNIVGKKPWWTFGQRQYIEHCVINSFPFRTIAQFLFLISLELELHKSEVGPVVAVIRGVLLPSQGCWCLAVPGTSPQQQTTPLRMPVKTLSKNCGAGGHLNCRAFSHFVHLKHWFYYRGSSSQKLGRSPFNTIVDLYVPFLIISSTIWAGIFNLLSSHCLHHESFLSKYVLSLTVF